MENQSQGSETAKPGTPNLKQEKPGIIDQLKQAITCCRADPILVNFKRQKHRQASQTSHDAQQMEEDGQMQASSVD